MNTPVFSRRCTQVTGYLTNYLITVSIDSNNTIDYRLQTGYKVCHAQRRHYKALVT